MDEHDVSLLSFLNSDGSINLADALKQKDDEEELFPDHQFFILECLENDGSLNLFKFSRCQENLSLFEMSLLHKAEMTDNSNNPIREAHDNVIKPRSRGCMSHQQFVGDTLVVATPFDSSWYLMYVKCPMLNVPKFHRQFRCRF
jgi:hypothetical protein